MDVEQPRRIGDRGVTAVEDPDLHQFVGRNVGRERDPDGLQRRPPGREPVLHHPLPELFAEDRPIVLKAALVAQKRPFPVGRRRRDAVDHRIGEGDAPANPAREFGIGELSEAGDGVLGDMTVAGDVVAGHHGERRNSCGAAALERGGDEAKRRLRRFRVLGVVDDVGMGGIEMLGRWRDVVAALGDGQRDDASARLGERVHERRDIVRPDKIDHRTGDADMRRLRLLLDDCRQPVLFLKLLTDRDVRIAHPRPDDRPVVIAPGVEQIVEIDRLMRAVKVADANMNDAGAKVRASIFRRRDACRQARERCG